MAEEEETKSPNTAGTTAGLQPVSSKQKVTKKKPKKTKNGSPSVAILLPLIVVIVAVLVSVFFSADESPGAPLAAPGSKTSDSGATVVTPSTQEDDEQSRGMGKTGEVELDVEELSEETVDAGKSGEEDTKVADEENQKEESTKDESKSDGRAQPAQKESSVADAEDTTHDESNATESAMPEKVIVAPDQGDREEDTVRAADKLDTKKEVILEDSPIPEQEDADPKPTHDKEDSIETGDSGMGNEDDSEEDNVQAADELDTRKEAIKEDSPSPEQEDVDPKQTHDKEDGIETDDSGTVNQNDSEEDAVQAAEGPGTSKEVNNEDSPTPEMEDADQKQTDNEGDGVETGDSTMMDEDATPAAPDPAAEVVGQSDTEETIDESEGADNESAEGRGAEEDFLELAVEEDSQVPPIVNENVEKGTVDSSSKADEGSDSDKTDGAYVKEDTFIPSESYNDRLGRFDDDDAVIDFDKIDSRMTEHEVEDQDSQTIESPQRIEENKDEEPTEISSIDSDLAEEGTENPDALPEASVEESVDEGGNVDDSTSDENSIDMKHVGDDADVMTQDSEERDAPAVDTIEKSVGEETEEKESVESNEDETPGGQEVGVPEEVTRPASTDEGVEEKAKDDDLQAKQYPEETGQGLETGNIEDEAIEETPMDNVDGPEEIDVELAVEESVTDSDITEGIKADASPEDILLDSLESAPEATAAQDDAEDAEKSDTIEAEVQEEPEEVEVRTAANIADTLSSEEHSDATDSFTIPPDFVSPFGSYPNPLGLTEEDRKSFHPVVIFPKIWVKDETDGTRKQVPAYEIENQSSTSSEGQLATLAEIEERRNLKKGGKIVGGLKRLLSKTKDEKEAKTERYGVGRYDENRINLYDGSELFQEGDERRTVHIGIDLDGPLGTKVHAFTKGVIHSVGYNAEHGDYGHVIVVEHELENSKVWALYGHLDAKSTKNKKPGQAVKKGQVLGRTGDIHENGGWTFPHVHFQLSLQPPETHDMPGTVSLQNRGRALVEYPDPRYVLGPLY